MSERDDPLAPKADLKALRVDLGDLRTTIKADLNAMVRSLTIRFAVMLAALGALLIAINFFDR